MDCSPPGSFVHGDYPSKNARVGCHALLQGIFPNQGSNPGLLYCRQILYRLCHQGSPRILEWVVYPFSRGSSQPRNQTQGLLHCRQILYHLNHQGNPRILEWVVYPFSRGSSLLRNRTGVPEMQVPPELPGKPFDRFRQM